jgi:hypothetical protein
MPKHDSIFKRLLRSFFADLLRLTVPDLAASLDLPRPVLLDKEFFTIGGRRRELDFLAEVSLLKDGGSPLLVHVEVEARARPEMGRRLWHYRHQIQAIHDRHVLSIVLYLDRGPGGVQVRTLEDDPLGPGLADFHYVAFGLAGCDPSSYLARPEPLAWGLAGLMRGGNLTRPELKLACLSRVAAAELDADRRMLLVDCIEMYLELNPEEVTEYSALCAVRKNREVRTMEATWSERMKAEGREEGLQKGLQQGLRALRKVVLSLLEQRFGPLPEETRERVEAISSLERLTRLGSRVLTARSLAALKLD